jgi:folate-dependent phosphoribosylglycinamide formyltransferase PurN
MFIDSLLIPDALFYCTGTKLQAPIDFTRDPLNFSAAEIVLVISNKTGVEGLVRAEKAGIASKASGQFRPYV